MLRVLVLTVLAGCVPLSSPSDRIDPPMDAHASLDAQVDAHLPDVDAASSVMSDAAVASPDATAFSLDAPSPVDAFGVTSGDLRSSSGFVEVYYMGEWRPICDDLFDTHAATVACRQLGYSRATTYMQVECPSETFWLDDLMCNGTELRLAECRHRGWGVENCSSAECVQVVCA